MSEFIRLQANGADAYPDASTENTYRPNGTSVESALVNLESNVTTLGGVAGDAKTLAEQNSVKIATAEQEISDINSSLTDVKESSMLNTIDVNVGTFMQGSPQTFTLEQSSNDYNVIAWYVKNNQLGDYIEVVPQSSVFTGIVWQNNTVTVYKSNLGGYNNLELHFILSPK